MPNAPVAGHESKAEVHASMTAPVHRCAAHALAHGPVLEPAAVLAGGFVCLRDGHQAQNGSRRQSYRGGSHHGVISKVASSKSFSFASRSISGFIPFGHKTNGAMPWFQTLRIIQEPAAHAGRAKK
jgi:hypothetical protein